MNEILLFFSNCVFGLKVFKVGFFNDFHLFKDNFLTECTFAALIIELVSDFFLENSER